MPYPTSSKYSDFEHCAVYIETHLIWIFQKLEGQAPPPLISIAVKSALSFLAKIKREEEIPVQKWTS